MPVYKAFDNTAGFEGYIKNLRRYSRTSIILSGCDVLWSEYKTKNTSGAKEEFIDRQLVRGFGQNIILYSYANGSSISTKKIDNTDFLFASRDFLNLNMAEADADGGLDNYFNQETNKLIVAFTRKKKRLPEQYITYDILHPNKLHDYLANRASAQNRVKTKYLFKLYTGLELLLKLDAAENGEVLKFIEKLFGLSILSFCRSAFLIFAIALDKNGYFSSSEHQWDEPLSEAMREWQVSPESVARVANILALSFSDAKQWYNNEVMGIGEPYKALYPLPLYRSPLLKFVEKGGLNRDMLLISPWTYFDDVIEAVFLRYLSSFSSKEANARTSQLGTIFCDYIKEAFSYYFAKGELTDLDTDPSTDDRRADLKVSLSKYDVFIEIKLHIIRPTKLPVLTPEFQAELWSELYEAFQQCAVSIQKSGTAGKPAIALIVSGNKLIAECEPFLTFAQQSGLFSDLGINYAGIASWDELELTLINGQLEAYCENLLKHENGCPSRDATFKEVTEKALHTKKVEKTFWGNLPRTLEAFNNGFS